MAYKVTYLISIRRRKNVTYLITWPKTAGAACAPLGLACVYLGSLIKFLA